MRLSTKLFFGGCFLGLGGCTPLFIETAAPPSPVTASRIEGPALREGLLLSTSKGQLSIGELDAIYFAASGRECRWSVLTAMTERYSALLCFDGKRWSAVDAANSSANPRPQLQLAGAAK